MSLGLKHLHKGFLRGLLKGGGGELIIGIEKALRSKWFFTKVHHNSNLFIPMGGKVIRGAYDWRENRGDPSATIYANISL